MEVNDSNDSGQYLEQLVGEGKKYKSVEELAKAYSNADKFIESLKAHNEDLKGEVQKRMAIEEFIKTKTDKDDQTQQDSPVDPNAGGAEGSNQPEPNKEAEPKVNESELIERIKAELAKEDEQKTAAQNTELVVNRLKEVYGNEEGINKAIGDKANELGVDIKFLQDMAAKSPKGFFSLLGVEGGSKTPPSSPEGRLNTAGLKPAAQASEPQPGTKAYYDELRKKDLTTFLSARVQAQYHKDATSDPDKFFGRNS